MTDNEAAEALKTLIFEDRKLNDAVCVVLSALRTWQESKKFSPPCYQPEQFGGGCAYQCYDGDDEPIDKCKECPLCNSDKHRKQQASEKNEPLMLEEVKAEYEKGNPIWIDTGATTWPAILDEYDGVLVAVWECSGDRRFTEYNYGEKWTAYRHPPEGGANEHI